MPRHMHGQQRMSQTMGIQQNPNGPGGPPGPGPKPPCPKRQRTREEGEGRFHLVEKGKPTSPAGAEARAAESTVATGAAKTTRSSAGSRHFALLLCVPRTFRLVPPRDL